MIKNIIKNKKFIISGLILAIIAIFLIVYSNITRENKINSIKNRVNTAPKGSFVYIGETKLNRENHIATTMKNGQVLIVGGKENTAELYNPLTYQFKTINKSNLPNMHLRAVLLDNGEVLLAGASILVIYNPIKNIFYQLKENVFDSIYSEITLTKLSNGNILITGTKYKDFKIYNPLTKRFSITSNMKYQRKAYTSTLLPNGRILITGGIINSKKENKVSTTEIYIPETNKFSSIESMHYTRSFHTATLLKDGRVLIVGGQNNDVAEIYDYKTNKFYLTGKPNISRIRHTATLLKDGRILIVGGYTSNLPHKRLNNSEIYDPKTNKFYQTGKLKFEATEHQATILNDGKVLITGGYMAYRRAELYIP